MLIESNVALKLDQLLDVIYPTFITADCQQQRWSIIALFVVIWLLFSLNNINLTNLSINLNFHINSKSLINYVHILKTLENK